MESRFTVCTLNLWKDERWPEREPALRRFLALHRPDILCLQELRPVTRAVVDDVLDGHVRLNDPFPGYRTEGNIYWNSLMFSLEASGEEDVGIEEPDRRLFWARLRLGASAPSITVATAHLTWPEHPRELDTGVNLRIGQAERVALALDGLAPPARPLLFMGDLNGPLHPVRILRGAGLRTCFEALGRQPQPTFPTVPTGVTSPKAHLATTIDWLMFRGPLAPMTCDVVDLFVDGIAPSDHRPIIATFRTT